MNPAAKRRTWSLVPPTIRCISRVTSALPERSVPGMADFVRGRLAPRIYRADRVAAHLRMALGDRLDATGIERLAQRYYEHASVGLVELARYRWWNRERILAATDRNGLPTLDAALRRGR